MKIEAITVCVDYSDFLAWSLLYNKAQFDRLIVVSDTKDKATADLCEYHHVECVKTDAFYAGGVAFDKGAGINAGLAKLDRDGWVCHFDADIILPARTRPLLELADLDPATIYGCDRMMCQGFEDWLCYVAQPEVQHSCEAFVQAQAFPLGARVGDLRKDGYVPIGFFQLWHPGASGVLDYSAHSDAGRGDMTHAKRWPRGSRALLPEIVAIHLESESGAMGANWRGRRTRPFGPACPPRKKPTPPCY